MLFAILYIIAQMRIHKISQGRGSSKKEEGQDMSFLNFWLLSSPLLGSFKYTTV